MALARDWKLSHKTRYCPSKNRPLHKFGSRRSVQRLECLILGLDGGDVLAALLADADVLAVLVALLATRVGSLAARGTRASRWTRGWAPPRWRCRPAGSACVGRMAFLTMLTFSTTTRSFSRQRAQHAARPCRLSLPAMTLTLSPLLDRSSCSIHYAHLPYSVSGARDTIFMYFLSRSSRATGPKMRVPRGAPSLLMSTAAFWSKLDVAAVGATDFLLHAHDDAAHDLALLDVAVGRRFLHAADDHVTEARVTALGAAQDLDALHLASAGVVGHCEHGLHLNHVL